jgi:hypothetical protein
MNQGDPGSAPQVGWCLKFTETAVGFGIDGVCQCQTLGFKIGETGESVEEGLDTLHHERPPDLFSMWS